MDYAIEAVRRGGDGHIPHVRWHSVRFDGERVARGESTVVQVVDAAVCSSHGVRVFVQADTGHFFRMRPCDDGIDAEVDRRGTPLRERMAHLPSFRTPRGAPERSCRRRTTGIPMVSGRRGAPPRATMGR